MKLESPLLRKSTVSLTIFLAMSLATRAQEVGGYGFLELPVSAHSAALGGTVVSVVEPEAELADQNPSLLCPEMSGQVSASYMNYVSDINLASASFTSEFLNHGAWQAGLRYAGYGDFEGYDEFGSRTGTFSAKDIAFHCSVGYPLAERWRIGTALRGVYTKYESYSAFAMGVDVGLNYYNEVVGRSSSVVLSNLGGQLKSLENRRSHLPTQLAVGITREVEHLPFCFTMTAIDLLDWDQEYTDANGEEHTYKGGEQVLNHLLLGAEWIASENFYLAAAYNYRRQREFSGNGGFLRGMSFGTGIKYDDWRLQASYARYNAVDGSLTLTLSYTFK